MYIVVCEVQNLKMLTKLKHEKMKEFNHSLISAAGAEPLTQNGNYLFFECAAEPLEMVRIINTISGHVYHSRFLHGVNLFVEKTSDLETIDLSAYISLLCRYTGLNQTCVGPEFAKEIISLDAGTCTQLADDHVWQLTGLKAAKAARKQAPQTGYGKVMRGLLSGHVDEPRYIVTASERESWLLADTLADSIILVFNDNPIAPYKPFLKFHAPISQDDIYERLSPEDQAVLLRTQSLQDRSEYTWNHSEVFLRVSALLKGYAAFFRDRNKKPRLQVLNAHMLGPEQIKLLSRIVSQNNVKEEFDLLLYGTAHGHSLVAEEFHPVYKEVELEEPDLGLAEWLTIHSDELSRSVVYGCIDLHGVMKRTDVVRALAKLLERPVKELQSIIRNLYEEKIFFGREYIEIPEKQKLLEQKSDLFLKREILSSLDEMIYREGYSVKTVSFETISICMQWNAQQIKAQDFLKIALNLLRYRKFEQLEFFFDYLYQSPALFSQLDLLNDFVCFKKYMARKELHEAEKIFKKFVFFDDGSSVLYPHIRLAIGEYYYCCGKYSDCLNAAKKLIFFTQDNGLSEMEAPAHMLLGHAMLKLGKNNEAIEYFGIAVDEAKHSVYPGDYTHALTAKSISLFIRGNYSMAIRNIEAAYASSETEGFAEQKIFCRFFSGRCHFIVGMYDSALLLFQEALAESSLNQYGGWEQLLQSWMGRCYSYMGHFERAFSLLESLGKSTECLFFLGECHYFYDHIKEARHLVHAALEQCEELLPQPNQYLMYDPQHGMYDIEGHAFENPHIVLYRVILSFWGYLENFNDTQKAALEVFDEILKSENLSENDPYMFFYYLCYSLTDKLKNHVDVLEYLTVLSKGIRHIQGVAARIDDVDKRLSYLNKSYWTKKMIDAGKAHKLT